MRSAGVRAQMLATQDACLDVTNAGADHIELCGPEVREQWRGGVTLLRSRGRQRPCLRQHGAADSCPARALRRHGVFGQPAPSGDRRAHGPQSHAGRSAAARGCRWNEACRLGDRPRPRRLSDTGPRTFTFALWHPLRRPGKPGLRRCNADCGSSCGLLLASALSDTNRSDERTSPELSDKVWSLGRLQKWLAR